MDILESTSQVAPIELLRDKNRVGFSCSVETRLGDNPRCKYTSTLSVTGDLQMH